MAHSIASVSPMRDVNLSVISLHRSLVEIPSLSREEGPIADFIESFLRSRNSVHVRRIDNNLCITLGDGPKTLLLNTHLDVVPPSGDHPFEPFKAVLKDGLVYGRGSVDAKASVAAMSVALLSLAQENYVPPGGRVILALTVCEELGGDGNGLQAILPQLPRPDAAIIGEPTEMLPCTAQKGLLILRMISRGKTAHAARAHLGENAVALAAADIERLGRVEFDRVHPELGRTTQTVTTIQGGTARNVVPDCCTTYLDIRTTPSYQHHEIVDLIRAETRSEIEIHSDRLVPVETSLSEVIVRACLSANPDGVPFGSPTLSDWIYLDGVPVVKMGPGDSRFSHRADECVSIEQLELGVDIYRKVIQSYFLETSG